MLCDSDKFQKLVLMADFPAALAMIPGMTSEQLEDVLVNLAYDTASICTYAFVCQLISDRETPEVHYLASVLLSQPLCHLTNAYHAAFFHAKRAAELAPDSVDYMEYMLFFYGVPDGADLLNREQAQEIARGILAKNPTSAAARKMIEM